MSALTRDVARKSAKQHKYTDSKANYDDQNDPSEDVDHGFVFQFADCTSPYCWWGKTTFQSRFISTTVQPRSLPSSSALSSVPTWEWRS